MIIVLFSPESDLQFEKAFPAKNGSQISAFCRSLAWAEHIAKKRTNAQPTIAFFCSTKNESRIKFELDSAAQNIPIKITAQENWNAGVLLEKMSALAKELSAEYIVYARTDSPFLDAPLSKKLIQNHTEYKAEYTFADGYPAGFAPEILDVGAAAIMAELCKTLAAVPGAAAVTKDSIFDVIKADVNSFEIETEIASYDYRLLRLSFLCENKLNFLAAKNLSQTLVQENRAELLELDTQKIGEENVIAISDIAKNCAAVLKTVPAFYNVQINCACKTVPPFTPYAVAFGTKYGEDVLSSQKRMAFSQFEKLAEDIKAFSPGAVVSLSAWGEAVLHPELPLFIKKLLSCNLGVLVEVDGAALKEFVEGENYKKILALKSSYEKTASQKIIFIVLLDAFTQKTFGELHGCPKSECADLQSAIDCTKRLAADFPQTYAQFTRTTQNEDELENFYRAWSDKASATGGKLIIQKYDNFCGVLPSVKTADLAPVVREPCWHLRRDMEILFDGSVPLCREVVFENILGNVFNSSLEEIWQKKNSVLEEHIQKKYSGCCGKCDEYYTFNF